MHMHMQQLGLFVYVCVWRGGGMHSGVLNRSKSLESWAGMSSNGMTFWVVINYS